MVTASRAFVCVRPATYESESEAEFLLSLYRGREGTLENSVFALLGPDGKQRFSRPGRSPAWVFPSASAMAERLNAIAKQVIVETSKPNKTRAASTPPEAFQSKHLPSYPTLRLALNVAACDSRPLALLVTQSEEASSQSEFTVDDLARIAWSAKWVGQFHWATATDAQFEHIEALPPIEAVALGDGACGAALLIVEVGPLAQTTRLLASTSKASELASSLEQAIAAHNPEQALHTRAHVTSGIKQGVHWETVLPVTDPGIGPPGPRTRSSDRGRSREKGARQAPHGRRTPGRGEGPGHGTPKGGAGGNDREVNH